MEKLMTSQDVADYLACTTRHVFDLRRAGKLPFYKSGASVRFRASDVEAFVALHINS
jgi:excisionase family DNA binding protein